jgi:AraC-like DNA-binding protein
MVEVKAKQVGRALLESWRYEPGPAGATAEQIHAEYQVGLCVNMPGEYVTRTGRYGVPVGGIAVLPPDMRHSARDPVERRTTALFLMIYFRPEDVGDVRGWEGTGRSFRELVIHDPDLAVRIHTLFQSVEQDGSRLALDTGLIDVLSCLTVRHGREQPPAKQGSARREVERARVLLHDESHRSVTLDELAKVAGLSRYHLLREFRRAFGLTPHIYHRNLRIDRARQLLARGWPISRVVTATGFSDQSHLNRRFRQLVGVTPGQYRQGYIARSSKTT